MIPSDNSIKMNNEELSSDARAIKQIIPDWPLHDILKELVRYADTPQRVQFLVWKRLKKMNSSKRSSSAQYHSLPSKKLKCTVRANSPIVIKDDAEPSSSETINITGEEHVIDLEPVNHVAEDIFSAITKMVDSLTQIFPDVCRTYLRNDLTISYEYFHKKDDLYNYFVNKLLDNDYPRTKSVDSNNGVNNERKINQITTITESLNESGSNDKDNLNSLHSELAPNTLYDNNALDTKEEIRDRNENNLQALADAVTYIQNESTNNQNKNILQTENTVAFIPTNESSDNHSENILQPLNNTVTNVSINESRNTLNGINVLTFEDLLEDAVAYVRDETLKDTIPFAPINDLNDNHSENLDETFASAVDHDSVNNSQTVEDAVTSDYDSNMSVISDEPNVSQIVKQERPNEMQTDEVNAQMTETPMAEKEIQITPLMRSVRTMFPDILLSYLHKICKNKQNTQADINIIVDQLVENEYPKMGVEPESDDLNEQEKYEMILEVFPDADPTYLREQCQRFANRPDELKMFIEESLINRNYPKLEEYQRQQRICAQQKQYTTDFNIEKYLEVIPDPHKFFLNKKRISPCWKSGDKQIQDYAAVGYVIDFFKNHFNWLRINDINREFKQQHYNITKTFFVLRKYEKHLFMKSKRRQIPIAPQNNIPVLQEIAYLQHMEEIKDYLNIKKEQRIKARAEAKQLGHLFECACCYDEEVMEDEISTCSEGHVFCNECIIRSTEVAIGENKTDFPCLTECIGSFDLTTLQKVLKPKIFSKLALRKQSEEIKAAGIEELESCPFCDFAMIPPVGDKIFRCLNDECMRESCRQCHEPSHIPFRCEEIEKPDEVKARTYIEDKMTEALLRKCWKCGLKFIKESGCNKMTCSCGALMCYVCCQPVKDYTHFNGQGGSRVDLCPLYSDTNKLHIESVRKVAVEAQNEIKTQNPDIELKYDPLSGIPEAPKEDAIYRPAPAHAHAHAGNAIIARALYERNLHNFLQNM